MSGADSGSRADFNDNLAIEEFCATREYVSSMNLLDFFLKLSSQRPTYCSDPNKPEQAYNCYIRREPKGSDAPRVLSGWRVFRLFWRSRLWRYLHVLYSLYIAVKMLSICSFHLQYDHHQNILIKRTTGGEVRTEKCRIPNQLDQFLLDTERQVEENRQWLEFLGDPWMSSMGGTTINYLLPIWNSFIFYWFIMASCERCRWTIDQIGFIMRPAEVRYTVQKQLDYLATKLIKTITFYRISCTGFGSSMIEREEEATDGRRSASLEAKDDYKAASVRTKSIPGRVHVIVQRLDLIQQFMKTDYWNLANPVVYSVEWLRALTMVSQVFMTVVGFCGLAFWAFALGYWQLNEYHEQARARLAWIECQNWNPLAVPIHSFHRPEELSEPEIEAYAHCDGSFFSLVLYGMTIENKYFFTNRKMLTLFELFFTWPAVILCAILCFNEFGLSTLDKVRWLEQIRVQLEACYHKCLIKDINQNDQEQVQLLQLSMGAYLNYSLFLSRFEPFRRTATMFASQIFSQTLPLLISVYYLSTNYGKATNFLWHGLLIFYIGILINFYLICYSLVVRKARQVSKLIIKLSAASSQVNFQSEFIRIPINLWRRQILEDRQIVYIFGLNFFGIGITLSKIVSLNIYLLGLTFIVVRHSGIGQPP